jgi:cell division protease FtsH
MSANAPPKQSLNQSVDESMDRFFGWLGRNIVRVIIFFVIVALFWIVALPLLARFSSALPTVLALLFQLLFAVFFMIVQFAGLMYFLGRPRIYWLKPGEAGVTFADYRGNPEVLDVAKRVVVLLKGVKEFKQMGGEPTRGLMLYGPPGTGKSYLAQCISTEAGVPFGYCSSSGLQSMWMGMGSLTIKMLYRKAKKLAKKYGACILFLDEIDSIGQRRAGQMPSMGMGMMAMGGGGGIINELLMQLDPPPMDQTWRTRLLRRLGLKKGRAERMAVLTMGATNLMETLDEALLRPGRFDRKLAVHLPNADGRQEILEYYLAKVSHEALPMSTIVSDTIYYTPAAMKHIINEALINAHFDGRNAVSYRDISKAIDVHELGLKEPIRGMEFEERRMLAYHEAGHAYATMRLQRRDRLSKVSIIRHGGALGFSAHKPLTEYHTMNREDYLALIDVSLASRAAEELFLGTQYNGVVSDFAQATNIANWCIRVLGMDGTFSSSLSQAGTSDPRTQRRVERMLRWRYINVRKMLNNHRLAVEAIAQALLEKDELLGDEVYEIVRQIEGSEAPLPGHPQGMLPQSMDQLPAFAAANTGGAPGAAAFGGANTASTKSREGGD